MHTSVLAREELRIFEELISQFDSLSEAEMRAVGVTREWSAKDLLAHLAYSERAAAEQVRGFEAGRWSAKSVRARRWSVPTGRSFQRIGPPHGIFFARN